MEVPIGVQVECIDGPGGHTSRVVLNPVTNRITHLVVHEPGLLGDERMVPLEDILESRTDLVKLRLSRADLKKVKVFAETEYLTAYDLAAEEGLFAGYPDDALMLWPYVAAADGAPQKFEGTVPTGELAVGRGDEVAATDGRIGRVDEFLVDPVSDVITHLVMREGHLWGQKDVTIAVSDIDRIEEGVVHLKLSKAEVEALPSIPVRR